MTAPDTRAARREPSAAADATPAGSGAADRTGPDTAAGGGTNDAAEPPAEPSPSSNQWRRPQITRIQRRTDAVFAVFLFFCALLIMALMRVAVLYEDPASPVISVVLLAAMTLPLAFYRRTPIVTLVFVAAAFIGIGELLVPETVISNIALFMALYAVGAWVGDRRLSAIVRAVTVAVMFTWLLTSFFRLAADAGQDAEIEFGAGALSPMAAFMLVQVMINLLYFAGAVWFGNHAWEAAKDRAKLEERARQLQAERTLVEAQAVTIERIRLARELHDAVAHHVSLIGVQAGAARTLLAADPEKAAGALERVEDSSREAITELHGLLGTLREGDDPGHEPVGSLGVDRIDELIGNTRSAGLEVAFTIIGDPCSMRPLASLNLYRIAQEALTNVRKHAGPEARVDVRVRYLEGAVELEVADDGSGRSRRRTKMASGGLGLVGMQERVDSDGGELIAGPRREGGFLVRARIPLLMADDEESR